MTREVDRLAPVARTLYRIEAPLRLREVTLPCTGEVCAAGTREPPTARACRPTPTTIPRARSHRTRPHHSGDMPAPRRPAPSRPPRTPGRPSPPGRRTLCGWFALALGLLVAAAGAVPAEGSVPTVAPDRGPASLAVGAGAIDPSAAPTAASFAPPTLLVVRYRTPTAAAARLVRGFAAPPVRWAPGHRGVDLAADAGSAVLAPADGTVTFAGTVAGRGVVTVAHADGRRSSLEPVDPTVTVGQRLAAGDTLGTVSRQGWHCTAPCLHWGVREALDYLDPITLLPGGGPVVLLPDDA